MTAESSTDAKTRVLEATNIVELIGQTVKLKGRGNRYLGLCPFHSEKSPSFNVDATKQFFHCFGCKASGDAITFVMKRDRLSFVEALQLLAQQANIDLPRFGATKQNASERQLLLDAQSAACVLFEKSLSHPQLGKAARDYLSGRGFNAETIKKFQVGLAIESWDALLSNPAMKKFTPQLLAQAGLVKPRENGQGFYDTFRNRIMFPIRDVQGRIIAFGGRVVPGSQDPAKYLNSPETPLFNKSACIYGLDLSRQRIVETETVAIVEGYTDVMMAHQYGASNVVSVLGTALTEQHVKVLRRFAKRIVLLFDADTAGDLAADRAVQLLLSQEIDITIASMPAGVDPDEYLIANGVAGFEKMLADAADVLSFKWRQLLKDYGSNKDLTSQQKAIEQYLELLASARGSSAVDPLRWGAILTRVSRLTEIPTEELNRRFRVPKKRPAAGPASKATRAQSAQNAPAAETKPKTAPLGPPTSEQRAERWLLGVLLCKPSEWVNVQQKIQPQDFTEPRHRKIAELYWEIQRDEGEPEFAHFLGLIEDAELKTLIIELFEEVQAFSNIEQTLNDSMAHLSDARRRVTERKLVADLKAGPGAEATPTQQDDEIEMLRKLQESARRPDIRRAAP